MDRKAHLFRALYIYLGAAGIETLAMLVIEGEPHIGWGPVIFGMSFLFWASPPMLFYRFLVGDRPDAPTGICTVIFLIAFIVLAAIAYRRELAQAGRGTPPPAGN